MCQGQRKGRAGLVRRKTVGKSAGQHGRWERLLDVDSPGTRPHLNGAGQGVEVEGPRGVPVAAVRGGGGGVTAGATTTATATAAMGSAVVVPPSSAPRLSRVLSLAIRGGGTSHQGEAQLTQEAAQSREVGAADP
jgi:hypothetical protein